MITDARNIATPPENKNPRQSGDGGEQGHQYADRRARLSNHSSYSPDDVLGTRIHPGQLGPQRDPCWQRQLQPVPLRQFLDARVEVGGGLVDVVEDVPDVGEFGDVASALFQTL